MDFDVVVLGGGPAGLAFALLLAAHTEGRRAPPRIAVVEAGAPPRMPTGEPELRVLALSPESRAVLAACGAWQRMPAERIGPYRRMVVWQHEGAAGGDASITFDAAEEGLRELGHIVESELARSALWERASAAGAIELLTGVAPVALELGAEGAQVTLMDGRELHARLVVGADGHDSWARAQARVGWRERPYDQRAVVANVASERAHEETARQRFLPGGPLALLPLADGRCSIVWSCPEARSHELLSAAEDAFNRELTAASDGVLGELQLASARASFPLAAGHAERYTGVRFALIGDAAHRIHPLAGQGANLGFQDAAALAATLSEHLLAPHADIGDQRALRRYERSRRGANLAALATMDALHALFTSRAGVVARAAGRGLRVVDRLAPLKSRLAGYALGRRDERARVLPVAPSD